MSSIYTSAATGNLSEAAFQVIGSGPAYPFTFIAGTGAVQTIAVANGVSEINQSIHIILTTRPGERYMNPEFGSYLMDCVFEPNDFVLKDLLFIYTAAALERWERRIKFQTVAFPFDSTDVDNSIIRMRILYMVLQTSTPGSYVFPFQRQPMAMGGVVSGQMIAPPRGSISSAAPYLFG